MNEYLKKELDDIIAKQPRKRVDNWLRITIIFVSILASAFALNWFKDYQSSQQNIIDVMQKGFNKVDKRFNAVEKTISNVQEDVSDVKTDLSEQKQVTRVIVDQSSEVVKQAARQTQEIYNQMKRDQSPQDRRISEDESYITPIEPIESELQVYAEPIKKKLQ
jgi:septal ring factor EnvC (AmiA/AmiB activator)